jgi:hypothetical protein
MTKPSLPTKTWVLGHKPSSLPQVDRNKARVFSGAVVDTSPDTHRRWTQPGVWQGKANETAGERDKDHRWTRPRQGGKATGTGPAVSKGYGYPLVHIEHITQSKCRMGEILLHANKILHLLAKEITCYSFGHKCQLPMFPYAY